jgi:molybdopterin-guanine dinucleotide biosynthesis protein A
MSDPSAECPEATGFVLAGGKSRRFGEDKALFPVNGEPLIRRPVACLTALAPSVAIVAKHPSTYAALDVPVEKDAYPQQMPHVGILTGLGAAETAWSIFLACDMPAMTPAVVRTLYEARGSGEETVAVQAVVAESPSGVHPLVGCYHRAAMKTLRRAIDNEWSLRKGLSALNTRVVSFGDEGPFRNVNRKSDLPEES